MSTQELVDATKSYIPSIFVIALIAGALTLGMNLQSWTTAPQLIGDRVTNLELQRKQDMADITAQFKALGSSLDELRKAITDPLNSRLPVDLVRKTDLELFCLRLQVLNSDKQFKCPGA